MTMRANATSSHGRAKRIPGSLPRMDWNVTTSFQAGTGRGNGCAVTTRRPQLLARRMQPNRSSIREHERDASIETGETSR
jgi:hypothetical protein